MTLALDIIKKIPDGPLVGYHELGIIKHQIDLHDVISIENSSDMEIVCNDPRVPCDKTNICYQAVKLVQKECSIDKNVHITIIKNIPVMGGLAGGSANAATILSLLNENWQLGLTTNRLMELGRKLGMDVPFYFVGGTAFDSETGPFPEKITTESQFTFILALPDFGVSTKDAYRLIDYAKVGKKQALTTGMKLGLEINKKQIICESMHNDFEYSVFENYPALLTLKNELLDIGCSAAMMTGSGSTVIGIVENDQIAQVIKAKLHCKALIAHSLQ